MLEPIRQRSSHLAGVLERQLPGGDYSTLSIAFAYALAHGGEEEVGFSRKEGVSFNPRAARVPLILLNDLGVKQQLILSAAMVATSDNPGAFEIVEIAKLSQRAVTLSIEELLVSGPAESQIRIALALDFARHLHQLTAEFDSSRLKPFGAINKAEMRYRFLSEYHDLLKLVRVVAPGVESHFERWHERVERDGD